MISRGAKGGIWRSFWCSTKAISSFRSFVLETFLGDVLGKSGISSRWGSSNKGSLSWFSVSKDFQTTPPSVVHQPPIWASRTIEARQGHTPCTATKVHVLLFFSCSVRCSSGFEVGFFLGCYRSIYRSVSSCWPRSINPKRTIPIVLELGILGGWPI